MFETTTVPKGPYDGIEFSVPTHSTLCVAIPQGETVLARKGAMQAYVGKVSFKHKGKGMKKIFKSMLTNESGLSLMTCTAEEESAMFCSGGGRIKLLELVDDTIYINSDHVLAMTSSLDYDITTLKSIGAIASRGLFQLKISGTGTIAITTDSVPVVLQVSPDKPVMVDPDFSVAWSKNVTMKFKLDIKKKDLIGLGSGEQVQAKFTGEGFVVTSWKRPVPRMARK